MAGVGGEEWEPSAGGSSESDFAGSLVPEV